MNCLFANNGGDGVDFASGCNQTSITRCVAYNNTTYGYKFADDTACVVFYANSAYKNHAEAAASTDQLYNGSGIGGSSFVAYFGGSNVISDPLFVDPANDDYTLQTGSPLIGTGTNATGIGPTCHLSCAAGGFVYTGTDGGF
jgi:hypothetical protein